MSNSLLRLLRTCSYLRLSQIFFRVWYSLKRNIFPRFFVFKTVSQSNHLLLQSIIPLVAGDKYIEQNPQIVDEVAEGQLTLLSATKHFTGASDWQAPIQQKTDRLWYHRLHYHTWLVSLGLADCHDRPWLHKKIAFFIDDWIQSNPKNSQNVKAFSWNSYAIASRLDSWRIILGLLGETGPFQDQSLREKMADSIASQANYLLHNIEWDLRGNHLIRDALGLASASRIIDGEITKKWEDTAFNLALTQFGEQILEDGGHFERSPAYHLEIMHDLLKLIQLFPERNCDTLITSWRKMEKFVRSITLPDGSLPLLNDSWHSNPEALLQAGNLFSQNSYVRPSETLTSFPTTGIHYFNSDGFNILFDTGDIGPDFQPAHGHADTLSVLSTYKRINLFIDPGCFHYDHDSRRHYDRSTDSHNTVCIDQQDSSEVWHIFRVGRRCRVKDYSKAFRNGKWHVEASHNGFQKLPGKPIHTRHIDVNKNELIILDMIRSNGEHKITGGFLIDPKWTITTTECGWILRTKNEQLNVTFQSNVQLTQQITERSMALRYGDSGITSRLEWSYLGKCPLNVTTIVTVNT